MKETATVSILFVIVLVLIGALMIGLACSNTADETMAQYNNGVCECGGHWELFSVDVDKGNTYYFYKCDECGTLIKLHSQP